MERYPHLLNLQMPAELQVMVDAAASCGGAEGCHHWKEPRGDSEVLVIAIATPEARAAFCNWLITPANVRAEPPPRSDVSELLGFGPQARAGGLFLVYGSAANAASSVSSICSGV